MTSAWKICISLNKTFREIEISQNLQRVYEIILKTLCYSICKGREILAFITSRYIYDLRTCHYFCKWSTFFIVFLTGPQWKDASTSLTSRHYDERVCAIRDTIQFQFLERKRGKLGNYLPHPKVPSTPPSPQLSNLIYFTNSESVYPTERGDSW